MHHREQKETYIFPRAHSSKKAFSGAPLLSQGALSDISNHCQSTEPLLNKDPPENTETENDRHFINPSIN